jgi:hypothetical protein
MYVVLLILFLVGLRHLVAMVDASPTKKRGLVYMVNPPPPEKRRRSDNLKGYRAKRSLRWPARLSPAAFRVEDRVWRGQ